MSKGPSRLPLRAAIAWGSLRNSLGRARPQHVEKVLVAHNLLLGDTLMLTPLLAALRARYPKAQLVMTCSPAFLPLYEGHPYGIDVVAFNPRDPASLTRLREQGPYDLALVPAESRHGWLARAAGARWVRGFHGGPWYYRLALDEDRGLPADLEPLADIMALLGQHSPGRFDPKDWVLPDPGTLDLPTAPYAILHLGAGSPLKYWPRQSWRTVAESLHDKGVAIILSAGRGQEHLAHEVDPRERFVHTAGRLDLKEIWYLLKKANLLISPDTGITHLAKITQTPSVVLFGPGQAALYGPGQFFEGYPYRAVTVASMPCRDETTLFERDMPWIQTCVRTPRACLFQGRCSTSISVETVLNAVREVMTNPPL